MTHSLHRQGTYANLSDDFVVLGFPGREFADLKATLQQFRDIGFRHQPVNVPGIESPLFRRHLVYDSREKVGGLLRDLAAADLGLSVTVSGLRDQVAECCHSAGISRPHTVCHSMGFWGKTERLPHFNILEITTMCGHGRVSPNLVWHLAGQVQHHGLEAKDAARKMGKLCLCNIFNEVRAAKLLEGLVASLKAGTISQPQSSAGKDIAPQKDCGVIIDEARCINCLECIPYCPMSAIIESTDLGTVIIDADRCTECGLCRQTEVCPVEAIVGNDLPWPRSLRGKFQHLYAPYRSDATLVPSPQPVSYKDKVLIITHHELPSELTNDVEGLLHHGDAEIIVELGRPHLGATFADVQKMIQTLIPMGLKLGLQYPVLDERSSMAELATDMSKGILRHEILEERAGWVFLKMVVPEKRVPEVFQGIRQVAAEIDSVFALDLISRVEQDGSTVADRMQSEIGITPAVNCKTNIGLGRPLADN